MSITNEPEGHHATRGAAWSSKDLDHCLGYNVYRYNLFTLILKWNPKSSIWATSGEEAHAIPSHFGIVVELLIVPLLCMWQVGKRSVCALNAILQKRLSHWVYPWFPPRLQ